MAQVRAEARTSHFEKGIGKTGLGHGDLHAADRLAVGVVDHRTLMPAECADPIARAEEGMVARYDIVEECGQFRLHSALNGRLGVLGVAHLKGATSQDDSRPLVKVDPADRSLLHPDPAELSFVEARATQHGCVFVVRSDVISPNREEEEWLHVGTLEQLPNVFSPNINA